MLNLHELICVQELDDRDEELSRNTLNFDVPQPWLSTLLTCLWDLFAVYWRNPLSGVFRKTVLRVEHNFEVFASRKQYCTVGFNEINAIQLKDYIKEVIQVAALAHFNKNMWVVPVDLVLSRENKFTLKTAEFKLDSVLQLIDSSLDIFQLGWGEFSSHPLFLRLLLYLPMQIFDEILYEFVSDATVKSLEVAGHWHQAKGLTDILEYFYLGRSDGLNQFVTVCKFKKLNKLIFVLDSS